MSSHPEKVPETVTDSKVLLRIISNLVEALRKEHFSFTRLQKSVGINTHDADTCETCKFLKKVGSEVKGV